MTPAALIGLLQLFDHAALEVWLDGGWGVDALLGEQTRPHKDADLVVRVTDLPRLDGLALVSKEFDLWPRTPVARS